ncbi:toxin Cry1Ac domain D-VI-related protein, partial [Listeria booriae]
KAVNELFNNNTPSTDAIKGTTDQAAINAAKALVDAVTDPTVKAALQKDLNRAQELLDAKNAAAAAEKAKQDAALKAVNELFNNNTPSTDAIKGTTDQAAINAAKALVDAVTDPTVKAALQKDLNRAQELLDASNVLAKPQLNPMTEADTVFSGKLDIAKYNPGTIRIYINNTPATVVAVDASGNFSYNIGNRKAGDTISVDYKDRTGQYNAATKTSITVTPVSSNVTINKMTENDDTITGKTAPNAKVRYVVGGQPVNVGYADVNGNYTMYIGKQKVGTVVGVEVFDPATNKYKAAVTTTVLAVNVTIQAMTNATDTVSGTAPANAKLRFLIGGVAVNVGTADANGNYSKYVGTQIVGTEVAVEMLNPETGKYELAKKIQVTGAPKSTTYTVNALTTEDDTLKGTAPANAKLRFSINGNLISVITADASGNYSKYIGKQKAGVDVSVELLNENTNQYTAPQSVTVTTGTGNATLAPVINTITEGQGVVTGTVPTSISQVRVWVNGTAQTMVAVTNGNFTWTKANLKVDDKVKVDYKDATGTWISAEKIVTN